MCVCVCVCVVGVGVAGCACGGKCGGQGYHPGHLFESLWFLAWLFPLCNFAVVLSHICLVHFNVYRFQGAEKNDEVTVKNLL